MNLRLVTILFTFVLYHQAIGTGQQISKRAIIYQKGATATILAALAIPLEIEDRHVYVAINYSANYMNPQNATWFTQPFNRFHEKNKRDTESGPMNRYSFYKTIVKELDKFGFNGKECLLRSICEASYQPIDNHNGVLGDVLQLVFSPSSSGIEKKLPTKFYEAERYGRQGNCEDYNKECGVNLLDFFTSKL